VVRVNAILNNSEPKILQKFREALGMTSQQNKQFYTIEMVSEI